MSQIIMSQIIMSQIPPSMATHCRCFPLASCYLLLGGCRQQRQHCPFGLPSLASGAGMSESVGLPIQRPSVLQCRRRGRWQKGPKNPEFRWQWAQTRSRPKPPTEHTLPPCSSLPSLLPTLRPMQSHVDATGPECRGR